MPDGGSTGDGGGATSAETNDVGAGVDGASTGSEDAGAGVDEASTGLDDTAGEACSAAEVQLIELVNAYRGQRGHPAVPINDELCAVAHIHAVDLAEQAPHQAGPDCTLHSWSDAGPWTPCCYTSDLAQTQCMWSKPGELTAYAGSGHEAAAAASDPASALAAMQADGYADALILNQGIWDATPWQAAGAAIHGGHALLWFGPTPQ